MICPKCGEDNIRVQVTFQGHVDIAGGKDWEVVESEPGDSYWENDSDAECLECNYTGTTIDFQKKGRKRA